MMISFYLVIIDLCLTEFFFPRDFVYFFFYSPWLDPYKTMITYMSDLEKGLKKTQPN